MRRMLSVWHVEFAKLGRQVLADAIDAVLLLVLLVPANFLLTVAAVAMMASDQPTWPLLILGNAINFSGFWAYFFFFESSSWQATPGKRLLKLYVTDLWASPMSNSRAVLRAFFVTLNFGLFGMGYLYAFFSSPSQTAQDYLAGTLVLSDEQAV